MSRQRLLILTAFTLLLLPTLTLACGGFFCTTTPIDQSAERIIFLVNDDETITAIVGINYTGAAEDFSWVVPVPSPPVLDVAEAATLNALDQATAVQVNNPPRLCSGIFPQPCCFGGGGDGGYLAQGNVGPYDYAIIGSENPAEMIAWLRENGYRITEAMEPLIEVYVEEEMYFLAMKLSQDADVGDIQPVVMTYESVEPMIPIRLTAVAAIEDMPIITWIFADEQYVPENDAHPSPDFRTFRAPGEIATDSFGNYGFQNGNGPYQAERARIQDAFDGLAFITEYAGPTQALRDLTQNDALFEQLIDRFSYVTRLRAQMSPEQMTVDPMFIPAPGAPDVSNIVNLEDYIDPLEYWGCSSRTALSEETLANLPDTFTRIDALQLHVAHPDNWALSEFDVGEQHFWAFAPKAVHEEAIAAYFAGVETAPMLVFTEVNEFWWAGVDAANSQELLTRLNQQSDEDFIIENEARSAVRLRYWPIGGYGDYEGLRAVLFGVLASSAQWEADGALYDAMLAYADSYQYFLSSNYRHTLFLNSSFNYEANILVSYPDGWREQVSATDRDVLIVPEDTSPGEDIPLLRFTSITRFEVYEDDGDLVSFGVNEAGQWVVAEFGLLPEDVTVYMPAASVLNCDTSTHTSPIRFENNGHTVYVRFMSDYIVSATATTEDFAQYEDVLLEMLNGIEFVDCG